MKLRTYYALIGYVAVMCLLSQPVFAGGRKSCDSKKGLEHKILGKIHFVLQNEDELKLTAEQKYDLKELKKNVKRQLIQSKAAIDLLTLDIKDGLWNDPIDVDTLNGLVDQKYELKKQKSKELVQAYANFKRILTADQKAELKKLYKQEKNQKQANCPMWKK